MHTGQSGRANFPELARSSLQQSSCPATSSWHALTDPAFRPPEPLFPILRAVVEQRSARQVHNSDRLQLQRLCEMHGGEEQQATRAEHLKILLADMPACRPTQNGRATCRCAAEPALTWDRTPPPENQAPPDTTAAGNRCV